MVFASLKSESGSLKLMVNPGEVRMLRPIPTADLVEITFSNGDTQNVGGSLSEVVSELNWAMNAESSGQA